MDNKTYVDSVIKTESVNHYAIDKRLTNSTDKGRYVPRLLHAAIGMCTETGEIQDQLKKYIYYGKDLDEVNLVEELGDLLWYIGLMCVELGVPLGEVMEKNIAKLKARYGDKFSEDKAVNRDLKAEGDALKG